MMRRKKSMKKSFLKLVVSAALLGGALAAQAGTDVDQWTVGAGLMWTQTDADRRVDDNYGFNYEFGYAMSEKWDVALNLFSGNHDDLAAGANWDREIKGATIDFDRVYNRSARVSPFVLIGFGIVDQSRAKIPYTNKEKEVTGKLGAGIVADLTAWSGGKLQLKGAVALRGAVGKGIIDGVATLNLQAAFGSGK
jgi:hypothetical protein